MKVPSLIKFLTSFGNQVVRDSQNLLKKEKGETALGKSIRFEVVAEEMGYATNFYMEDYGEYLDQGVSGNKKKRSYTTYLGSSKASPYSYTTKGPPIDILSKWIKKKGIEPKGLGRGRSKKTGQYISGFAYLISKKIKREGIKSLSFFQIPLGVGYKNLQNNLLKELKVDIRHYITEYYRPK
tara:strand:- start:61 stop:606 length:546 start_codon:yes stop_codon:yes gene_type:complete